MSFHEVKISSFSHFDYVNLQKSTFSQLTYNSRGPGLKTSVLLNKGPYFSSFVIEHFEQTLVHGCMSTNSYSFNKFCINFAITMKPKTEAIQHTVDTVGSKVLIGLSIPMLIYSFRYPFINLSSGYLCTYWNVQIKSCHHHTLAST